MVVFFVVSARHLRLEIKSKPADVEAEEEKGAFGVKFSSDL